MTHLGSRPARLQYRQKLRTGRASFCELRLYVKVALPLPPLPDERAEEVLRDEGLVLEDLPRQRRGVLVREPALNRRPLVDVAVERADLPQARARVKEKRAGTGGQRDPGRRLAEAGRGWPRLAEAAWGIPRSACPAPRGRRPRQGLAAAGVQGVVLGVGARRLLHEDARDRALEGRGVRGSRCRRRRRRPRRRR